MGFWEWMSKIDPPTFVAGSIGIVFVLVVFILAARVIGRTEAALDADIVRMRFAQVMFIGIITILIFTSILYLFSTKDGSGQAIFEKSLTAMTPLAGVIIGYLFGSKTDSTKTEQNAREIVYDSR